MNRMSISTDPSLLSVELPRTLIESPSVSTFLPEEEASTCPLISNTNGTSTPLTFSHPLTPSADNDSSNSGNMGNEDTKAETSSSSGSSSGIGMDVGETAATSLFNKHVYQHLQKNNGMSQESNGHGPNGNLSLSKDTPLFVSWNWPLIRKCTFFIFMSSLLAMCAVVVAMIATLPKSCNPRTAWFRGSVFYEIYPPSFQDSDGDGVGDIRGIANRIHYIASIGVSAVRLNSIFQSEKFPNDYENASSLTEIAGVFGTDNSLKQLSEILHDRNISLVLDLPVFPLLKKLDKPKYFQKYKLASNTLNASELHSGISQSNIDEDNLVSTAILKWIKLGVDGFYIKGIEKFATDENLLDNMAEWKYLIGKNRVLIISETILNILEPLKKYDFLKSVDLVDVHLDILNDTKKIEEQIKEILSGDLMPKDNGIWIQWSIREEDTKSTTQNIRTQNSTLAATLMQLMLPGTPNLLNGHENPLYNPHKEQTQTGLFHHLAPNQWSNTKTTWDSKEISYKNEYFEIVSKMIKLRDRSPSIYKNSICKVDTNLPNTQIRSSHDDIIIVERLYPRRNSFVSVSNYGNKRVTMDMTSMYYSGHVMLGITRTEKIFFGNFEIGPMETIVVKLDK